MCFSFPRQQSLCIIFQRSNKNVSNIFFLPIFPPFFSIASFSLTGYPLKIKSSRNSSLDHWAFFSFIVAFFPPLFPTSFSVSKRKRSTLVFFQYRKRYFKGLYSVLKIHVKQKPIFPFIEIINFPSLL